MLPRYITITKPHFPKSVTSTEAELEKLLRRRGVLLREKTKINKELFDLKYSIRDVRRHLVRLRAIDISKKDS
jgi:hypothetical protein